MVPCAVIAYATNWLDYSAKFFSAFSSNRNGYPLNMHYFRYDASTQFRKSEVQLISTRSATLNIMISDEQKYRRKIEAFQNAIQITIHFGWVVILSNSRWELHLYFFLFYRPRYLWRIRAIIQQLWSAIPAHVGKQSAPTTTFLVMYIAWSSERLFFDERHTHGKKNEGRYKIWQSGPFLFSRKQTEQADVENSAICLDTLSSPRLLVPFNALGFVS